jgi:hypothetical protein
MAAVAPERSAPLLGCGRCLAETTGAFVGDVCSRLSLVGAGRFFPSGTTPGMPRQEQSDSEQAIRQASDQRRQIFVVLIIAGSWRLTSDL